MRAAASRSRWERLRLGRVSNPFGANILGIATGSLLADEGGKALRRDVGADRAAGADWIRIDINWAEIQRNGPRHYNWSYIDRSVKRIEGCGMSVLGTIVFTPSWARPKDSNATFGPDPATYARFAAAAARHYGRLGVHAYEIWNEPNSVAFWTPRPNVAAYTQLLRAAYGAIKQSDPSATVITGGTAPSRTGGGSYSPADFLQGIYDHGGQGYFDAVGHHPYCWPAYPGARHAWSGWYQMYGTRRSLRSLMIAHGDGAKRIWATEFGAPTGGPGSHVSQRTQARMLIRAYKLFASYSWAGPLFFYQGRDLGTNPGSTQDFFGFLTHNFLPKPSYAAYIGVSRALSHAG